MSDNFDYDDFGMPDKPKRKHKDESFDWIDIWLRAVTQPKVSVYRAHLADPRMSMTRGLAWMLAASIIGTVLQAIASSMSPLGGLGDIIEANVSVMMALCCAPFSAIMGLIVFVVFNLIQYLFAVMLGGDGDFEEQVYSVATYAAPISIILGGAGMVPWIGPLAVLGILAYTFYLHVIAMQAVHSLSLEKAIIASLWWMLMFCMFLSLLIGLLLALGLAAISL
ncbi:MAG: YIP1 family protein [Anaerolineae bacterium]|nr:YIP1 family protein [Anaerolineae bacterium]